MRNSLVFVLNTHRGFSKTKEFIFPINKKVVASDTYYLMVHVPPRYEKQLRTGSFEIIKEEKRALLSLKKS